MPDRRALLTDREREIVAGEADVSDAYRYQTISRVRSRFDRLDEDLAALEAHGELAEDLREKVCGPESAAPGDTGDSPPASERRESPQNRSAGERDQSDVPGETRSATDSPASEPAGEDEGEALDSSTDELTWPANKDAIECVNASLAAKKYIAENDGATKAELVQNVMPENAVGYDVDSALEKLEAGERYRGAWWRRVVKPGLEADEEIEKPGPGGSEWRYVGEN